MASSIERAVDAALARGGSPSSACLCENDCRGLRPSQEDRGPFLGGLAARGIGLAVGLSAGLGLGSGAEPRAERVTLRGWRDADGFVLGGSAAAWLATRLLDTPLEGPARGRWSDCADGASSLNGVDARVRTGLVASTLKSQANAARVSDVTLTASIAYPYGVVLGGDPDHETRDLLVVTETLAASILLNDVVKRFFDRPRPFAHFCAPERPDDLCEDDAHYSFYSGHASTSFAGAVAAGTISHYHGYRNESWIWTTGLGLATVTAVLRVVADKHYFTDVLAGAAAGGLAGWLVPRLHRPREGPTATPRAVAEPPPAVVSVPIRPSRSNGRGAFRLSFGPGPSAEATWRW